MSIRHYVPEIHPEMLESRLDNVEYYTILVNQTNKSVHSFCIDTFVCAFVTATNSPLNTIFILSCSCMIFLTWWSTMSLASSRNWWDLIYFEFTIASVNIRFSKVISISRHLSSVSSSRALCPASTCTKCWHVKSLKLSSCYDTSDCLTPIDNRGCLIWLCSSNDWRYSLLQHVVFFLSSLIEQIVHTILISYLQ